MTIDKAKELDLILRFLSEKNNAEYSFDSWSNILYEIGLNNSQSKEYLSVLNSFGFLKLLEYEETDIPEVAITEMGLSFVKSEQSFVKFSINMNKNLVESIDRMLKECRQRGFASVTKDSSNELRAAINEAKSRDWIRKRNEYSYELTPLGMEVLDFDSIENYLIHKKNKKEIESTILQQSIINAENVVYGNNHGTINQSSSNSFLNNSTSPTINETIESKSKKTSFVEWIVIIVTIVGGLIGIYQFFKPE